MNPMRKALEEEASHGTTLNGANSLVTTGDYLVDLFGVIGSMRNRLNDLIPLFSKAMTEDKLLATKMSFYARNVRGGLGERETARRIWKYLANNYPDIMRKNLHLVPEFGRWDDMYTFVDTPVEEDMWEIVRRQLSSDISNMENEKPISILAKWLKSPNASSAETKSLGKLTAHRLHINIVKYRKLLSKLRKYIDVTEVKMSSGDWSKINYPAVPSRAMTIYRGAFNKHDYGRFSSYIEDVTDGKVKINASTLYPYDIVERYMYWNKRQEFDKVLEEQWKALPNYCNTDDNVIIMADVSGSMNGRPMATSVGLAIYFAERNHGAFAGSFMTFSSRPEFVQVVGDTLMDRIHNVRRASWKMNTNLEAAFQLVLNTAINNNIAESDMPKAIVVISDMGIDRCVSISNRQWSFYDNMKEEFANHGYKIPNIVFWNVNSSQATYHVNSNRKGVQLASGSSVAVFKQLIDNMGTSPYEAMVNTLSAPMYDCVTV